MPEPPKPLAHFGQQIRARRKQLGMNRAAFAEAAKVSESSIARLERGQEVRVSTYLAVVGYLRRQDPDALADRIALLSDAARERVLELIRRLEDCS